MQKSPRTTVRRVRSVPVCLLGAAAVTAALLVTGCSTQDRICGSGEYPVKAVGNTTGRACVPKGKQPPGGYVRYPAGKAPQHVGDKWDTYWSRIVVDGHGHIVSG